MTEDRIAIYITGSHIKAVKVIKETQYMFRVADRKDYTSTVDKNKVYGNFTSLEVAEATANDLEIFRDNQKQELIEFQQAQYKAFADALNGL